MVEFKPMKDFNEFMELSQRCYPGMKLNSKEEKERYTEHREKMNAKENIRTIGLYEHEKLAGGYIEYDYVANVYGTAVKAAGIGTVAVDLVNKKQGHAKRLIQKFLLDARSNGRPLAQLYPFQPSFYKKMGFGLGPKLETYRFHPSQLPTVENGLKGVVLGEGDEEEVSRCYHQWSRQTHGACDKPEYEFAFLKKEDHHAIGVRENGVLTGYVNFQFEQQPGDHFLQNDLIVRNFISTSVKAYRSLLAILHNQKDQVRSILFPTFDEGFSMVLDDPTHTDADIIFGIYHKTSEAGRGLMYRIIDVDRFRDEVKDHSFGTETVRIGWTIHDSLLEETYEAVWQFDNGRPQKTDQPADVNLSLGIGEFSSLMMGCLTLRDLVYRGSVEEQDREAFRTALDLFSQPTKPESWSFF
ncbi:GNAT family N-acetyltransferase [Halobacillus litoralis]|uniref:GNAT family N-acetyltransferase n=1 Tax=Halobacillus litoralis TaxID=45668 RepID=UPI001CD5DA46|nr:GNAT family N-acetyltransferase [Halobacillus litoralis]MCA0972033.1 GNAT family N-acetyltransferase [Halobacillus litoralis]